MSFQPGDVVRLRSQDPLECVAGRVDRVGVRQTRVNFVRMPWTKQDAPLPEMRNFPHDQLILCRDPWSDSKAGRWSSPGELALRVRAAELWLANTNGQLGNSLTDLLPHQVCLVHEVVERTPRRLLIAEEVGMGKTIETGMIVHALMQRRQLDRCLVICPAGQIVQWQEELEEKLMKRFEVYRRDVDGPRAFSFPFVIASLDTVKLDVPARHLHGKSHREILLDAPPWDLVVFDEAHRLTAKDYGSKTEKTLNYRLAELLCDRTRDFLFLTGTPHDGNDSKFRNLLKALDPEVVFAPGEKGRFFGNLILKNRKSEAINAEGLKLFKSVKVEKVVLQPMEGGERPFHAALTEYLREGYGVAGRDPEDPRSRAIGFVMTTFQKLATSSVAAVRSSLMKRLALLEGRDDDDAGDDSVDDERFLGETEQRRLEEIQAKDLREAFSDLELKMLRELVDREVPHEAKWIELQRLIGEVSEHNAQEKFLIFTEYRGTVAFLQKNLEKQTGGGTVVTIIGGMGATARKETIERFRNDPNCRFLVSTEAGGEGINLQFCNLIVNYDAPWNPFRLVQRTGRIHRIGQGRNMRVFNFRLRNDLDERLSNCHEDRVENAVGRLSEVTGWGVDDIRDQLVGFAQEFINYDEVYREALLDSTSDQSEAEIERGIQEAEEAFLLAYESVFQHAVSPFNPERFRTIMGGDFDLDELRKWLEIFLKSQGRRLMFRPNEQLWEFLVPEPLKDRLPPALRAVKGTFDRKQAIDDRSIKLFAFGHSVIDTLLRSALGPNSPGAAVSIGVDGQAGTVVWVLLREDQHSGSAAFRLLAVRRNENGSCTFEGDALQTISKGRNEPLIGPVQFDAMRSDVISFLEEEFPEIDFIDDRIHWLGLVTFSLR